MRPDEARWPGARAHRLEALGLNPQQVRHAVEGRRQQIEDSWLRGRPWLSCPCCPDPKSWAS